MVRKTKEKKEKKMIQKVKQNVKQSVHIHINEKRKNTRKPIEKKPNHASYYHPFIPSLVNLGVPESSGQRTNSLIEKVLQNQERIHKLGEVPTNTKDFVKILEEQNPKQFKAPKRIPAETPISIVPAPQYTPIDANPVPIPIIGETTPVRNFNKVSNSDETPPSSIREDFPIYSKQTKEDKESEKQFKLGVQKSKELAKEFQKEENARLKNAQSTSLGPSKTSRKLATERSEANYGKKLPLRKNKWN
jgi:hypothetical protein